MEELKIQANRGNLVACADLGDMYIVQYDIKNAIMYYEKAGLAKNAYQMVTYGISCLIYSIMLRKSSSKKMRIASRTYKKRGVEEFLSMICSVTHKDVGAYFLGTWYRGKDCRSHLEYAACLGHVDSLYSLGVTYLYPERYDLSESPNYKKAFKSLSKSAIFGNKKAMWLCSDMYKKGLGVDQNDVNSEFWRTKSGYSEFSEKIIDTRPECVILLCDKFGIEYGDK